MRRILIVIGVLSFATVQTACATTNDVQLLQQVQQLKTENEALRKENQKLRKLAVVNHRKANPPKAGDPIPNQVDDVVEVMVGESGYWLSAGGTRHNKRCRYYKNAKGRPCRKQDGKPCKMCGG